MSVRSVVVTRTGGFAGVRIRAEVDDPEEAALLSAAARASADRPANDRVRDGFTYEFTIVTTTTTETLEVAGSQLSPDLRPALRALLDRR